MNNHFWLVIVRWPVVIFSVLHYKLYYYGIFMPHQQYFYFNRNFLTYGLTRSGFLRYCCTTVVQIGKKRYNNLCIEEGLSLWIGAEKVPGSITWFMSNYKTMLCFYLFNFILNSTFSIYHFPVFREFLAWTSSSFGTSAVSQASLWRVCRGL